MRVAAAIEAAFDRRLPPAVLFEAPTVELLALASVPSSARRRAHRCCCSDTGGPARPLFLLHQIDGDVMHYREWPSR